MPTRPADHGASDTPLYAITGLTKQYVMGEVIVEALRGVDLEIAAGESLVILGPSGSGKSTLLNIVGGLDTPTEGVIAFKGTDIARVSEQERTRYRRHHIGFIFQFYNLMPNLTARENVELATEIARDPMDPVEALELVGLGARMDHFPAQLSGGEQQRVAIARAIAKRPEVLLCDEPTGALDIKTGKIVLQALADVGEQMKTTVITITHNQSIGGMADRVVHMKDGEVSDIIHNEQRMAVDELAW